jgi:hypothetical protein
MIKVKAKLAYSFRSVNCMHHGVPYVHDVPSRLLVGSPDLDSTYSTEIFHGVFSSSRKCLSSSVKCLVAGLTIWSQFLTGVDRVLGCHVQLLLETASPEVGIKDAWSFASTAI